MWEEINALLSQSWSRIFTAVANFLPGLLALLVILLFTIALAGLVRLVLRRFLRGIHFDEWVIRWGFPDVAEWSPKRSPSLLLVRIASWTILILGFAAGIGALDAALPSMLVVGLFAYIPDVLAAALGLKVLRVLSVEENSPRVVPVRVYGGAPRVMSTAAAPTPVEAGTLDVTAEVTLSVEVAPAPR